MILNLLVITNVFFCLIQIYLFSHQYLYRAYIAQILTFTTSFLVNSLLVINGTWIIVLYLFLNIFAIYQGFIGIKRIKSIGLDKIQDLRDQID